MKKYIVIFVSFIGFSATISSCGNGKHRCPAYGSIDNDLKQELVEEKA